VVPLQEISSSEAQRILMMRTMIRAITGIPYPSADKEASANFSIRNVAVFLLFLGLLTPRQAAAGNTGLVLHGDRSRPLVALTFDICQTPGRPTILDRRVIDQLVTAQVPATLFLGGDWLRTHPDEARRLAASPLFELANHSFSHPDLRRCTPQRIAAEVQKADDELYRRTGHRTKLFRLPFGYYNDNTLATLDALGVRVIQWDVVSGDPDRQMSAVKMLRTIRRSLRPGSIVIMHANGRGWHTAEALPGIIALLRTRGLQPVTMSQLLDTGKPSCRPPLRPGMCQPPETPWSQRPALGLLP